MEQCEWLINDLLLRISGMELKEATRMADETFCVIRQCMAVKDDEQGARGEENEQEDYSSAELTSDTSEEHEEHDEHDGYDSCSSQIHDDAAMRERVQAELDRAVAAAREARAKGNNVEPNTMAMLAAALGAYEKT